MELRNKKTGQLGNFIINKDHFECVDLDYVPEYRNLAELNDEWEDYEEPKDHWYINYQGEVYVLDPKAVPEYSRNAKAIGNYFKTKEEAEKAVEKLKSWKRLKDGGFYFTIDVTTDGKYSHNFILRLNCTKEKINKTFTECEQYRKDLHLLFGGEE